LKEEGRIFMAIATLTIQVSQEAAEALAQGYVEFPRDQDRLCVGLRCRFVIFAVLGFAASLYPVVFRFGNGCDMMNLIGNAGSGVSSR
jgi:hypothetical protein